RSLIIAGLAAAAGGRALAQDQSTQGDMVVPRGGRGPDDHVDDHRRFDDAPREADDRRADDRRDEAGPREGETRTYSRNEIVDNVSDFFGVTAENAGAAIERIFRDNGRPTAYIAGTEGSGAFFFGLRYGEGLLYMKDRPRMKVFWQGPTGGFDWGADGARVFTLCYNLQYPDAIFRRFPGVGGSAYLIGGMGVNYQRADAIT